ncbi:MULTISPECIES: aldo/keto reductase [unclassified Bacillus (in: firmicutes)]|uniref:aldo/keto reductase n=1 Tax=unclassified Bacillus (in: firmicutes) TaxID=185979 RepID=UPI0008F38BF9|nr:MULTISPECIES: aldo/keto reductase [unclassified Bacillus (in: firmicutes)]SFA97622.1 Predicted oxidoreductase [Bacillus sp. UNCCL13]SFQ80567.1 Predicted oxidoreductase [Bacillus sp. cl95]
MKKRKLGNSDLMVSELGLGCMSLGTDDKKAQQIIEAALDEGINYFDTADLYDFGVNEKLVGKALREVREQVIIATKVGNRWTDKKDQWTWDPSKAYIKDAVKNSLKRLGTDYIDLYQLHGGTIDDPIEETIEAFEDLKSEGYIRFYGISSIRPNVIREYIEKSNIVAIMMQYNLLDRRPEETVLPLLEDKGVSIVARGPLAKGLLSDSFMEKLDLGKSYLDYGHEELSELLPLLKNKLSSERSFTEVALQYNLAYPEVASVIAGASSVSQVRNNANAVKSDSLTNEEIALIQSITKANIYSDHR